MWNWIGNNWSLVPLGFAAFTTGALDVELENYLDYPNHPSEQVGAEIPNPSATATGTVLHSTAANMVFTSTDPPAPLIERSGYTLLRS